MELPQRPHTTERPENSRHLLISSLKQPILGFEMVGFIGAPIHLNRAGGQREALGEPTLGRGGGRGWGPLARRPLEGGGGKREGGGRGSGAGHGLRARASHTARVRGGAAPACASARERELKRGLRVRIGRPARPARPSHALRRPTALQNPPPPLAMGVELAPLVEKLNGIPLYATPLTMITLSNRSPAELKQLTNDVLAKVSGEQAADLSLEAPEVTNVRMLEFLRVLRYKPTCSGVAFRQGVARGDPEVLYPLLAWAAPQVPALAERAYIARYMVDVEVPDDFAHDPELVAVQQGIVTARQEFAALHKTVKGLKADAAGEGSATEVAERITAMEEDREQLTNKIDRMKVKMESIAEHVVLREAAAALRKSQDEDADLRSNIAEHRAALELTEAKVARGAQRLRELRAQGSSAAASDPAALITALQDEVVANKAAANERLPRVVAELRSKVGSLEEALSGAAVSEGELAALQRQLVDANGRLNEGMAARAARQKAPEEGMLRQQQSMANMVTKKRTAVMQRLTRLEEERDKLRAELGDAAGETQELLASGTGDSVTAYVARVRERMEAYNAMRAELDGLRTEQGVLAFTESMVGEREEAIRAEVAEMEAAAGVAGFTDAANTLQQVSEAKSGVDAQKGEALEEISRIIGTIQGEIKEQKSRLAPRIKELRAVRQQYQELEQEHAQRKRRYDEEAAVHENGRAKVASDVHRLREEVGRDESRYHYLGAMSAILDADVRRMGEERQRGAGSSTAEALKRLVALRKEDERRTQEVFVRAQAAEGSGAGQRDVIAGLTRLVMAKLELYQGQGPHTANGGMHGGYADAGGIGASVLEDAEVTLGGAERLVL